MGSSFSFKPAVFLLLISVLRVLELQGAETAEAVFQRASTELQNQQYSAAERDFQAVLQLEPANVGALGNLGVVYARTRRYALAIDVYRRALKFAPGDKALSTNLGLAFLKQEQFAEALPVFEKLAGDPSNLQASELVATCLVSLRRSEEALAALATLATAEPGNPAIPYLQGVALTRLKRQPEAHAAYQKMIAAASPAQANFLMGKATYETGNFEESAAFFRKTLAVDPAFEGVHRELGKTLVSLHEDDEAEKELRLAGAGDGEALYFLGALLSRNNPSEAAPLLNQARQSDPDFWGPYYYLGRIGLEEGRFADALALLRRAAALKPEESSIYYQMSRALQKLDRPAEARAALARVKELKDRELRREVDVLNPAPAK